MFSFFVGERAMSDKDSFAYRENGQQMSQRQSQQQQPQQPQQNIVQHPHTFSGHPQQSQQQFIGDPNEIISDMSDTMSKSSSSTKKRTRKFKNKQPNPHKVDQKAKLERSRQSARECRARKKLRYQYLEDLVTKREAANIALKKEIDSVSSLQILPLSSPISKLFLFPKQLQGIATLLSTGRCTKAEIERKFAEI